MEKITRLIIGLFLLTVAGCGVSPIEKAKNLSFEKSGETINELLMTHPEIIKKTIQWIEDDSLGQKGMVICKFSYNVPKQLDVPSVGKIKVGQDYCDAVLIFAIGNKSGRLLEVQVENIFEPDVNAEGHILNLEFPQINEFLNALENKTSITSALTGLSGE